MKNNYRLNKPVSEVEEANDGNEVREKEIIVEAKCAAREDSTQS